MTLLMDFVLPFLAKFKALSYSGTQWDFLIHFTFCTFYLFLQVYTLLYVCVVYNVASLM